MILYTNFLNKSLKRYQQSASRSIRPLLWAVICFVSFLLTSMSAQAQLISLNGGEIMTCQFVNNTTVPNNQIYICVLVNGQYLTPGGTMNAIVPGQNASAYSMTLAQIAALSPAGLQLPNINAGGRMWMSEYQPMNMPIVAGPGVVQPNIANPSDPNASTVFDWMEFAEGNDWIYCNNTQVNMFGIPYTMALYNQGPALNATDGINDCYADIVTKYKAFMATVADGPLFDTLIGPVRIVSPNDGTFATGAANSHYFDNYISQVWTEYQSKPLVISTGGNTYSGTTSGPGSQMVFTGPGGPYYVNYPTTQDVLGASGAFATGNATELAIEVVMDAGFNRHVIDNAANLNTPADYYLTAPCNYYAAFWHTVNQNALAYGFPYDDDNNQSSVLVSNNARGLIITFSGCVNTPTPTLTATNTFTKTATSTYSFTATVTDTQTVTNTATNTATRTYTSTATNSYTASPTATNTITKTFTNTFTNTSTPTSTYSSTATNSFTASPTSTNSFTATYTYTASPTSTLSSTGTATAIDTATSTNTLVSTATFSSTPTATYSMTPSLTSTSTASFTPSSTNTILASATVTNTATLTSTNTFLITPTRVLTFTSTPTDSMTPTVSPTTTATNTYSPTQLITSTFTPTATLTRTASITLTPTLTPTITRTPTITATPSSDEFFISKNVFTSDAPLQIHVSINQVPGHYDLTIFNSAGEHVKTLDSQNLGEPFQKTYGWDGTNKFGSKCASGVYVIYLTEPFKRLVGRVIFIH
jgi:hypothetical protein